jgi:PBP1b-binding outer membrane lipoprotein LpoB
MIAVMKIAVASVILGSLLSVGCANRMNAVVAPRYQSKVTPVSSIGVTGQGASVAFPAFAQRGYNVIESSGDSRKAPFLATVDAVGTDGAWWDGVFDFSMRVAEVATGHVVWSATAEYGNGVTINQVRSGKDAMRDMVESFAKNFPPKS